MGLGVKERKDFCFEFWVFKRLYFWLGYGYVFVLGFLGFGFSMVGCMCDVFYVMLVKCEHE